MLPIEITTTRMVDGTTFKRLVKAIERLYYLTLFSASDRPSPADDWQSWLDVGTHLTVRSAPLTADNDRYVGSVHISSRSVTIKATGDSATLETLAGVIAGIGDARATEALPERVDDLVRVRVEKSLGRGASATVAREIRRLIDDSVAVLTLPVVEKIHVELSAARETATA